MKIACHTKDFLEKFDRYKNQYSKVNYNFWSKLLEDDNIFYVEYEDMDRFLTIYFNNKKIQTLIDDKDIGSFIYDKYIITKL